MRVSAYVPMLAALLTLGSCGESEVSKTSSTPVVTETSEEVSLRAQVKIKELLSQIEDNAVDGNLESGVDLKPIKLQNGTTINDVEIALDELKKNVKPKDNKPDELDVNKTFEQGLDVKQKKALNRLVQQYNKRVKSGDLKPIKGENGEWRYVVNLPSNDNGRGRDDVLRHAVGDGWWRWSYSTQWWGHKLWVNHNFLYYLCSYTSWMLDASGLPSWAKYVVKLLVCAPHSLDSGADGSTIYVTWALVFWYSP